ncbi:LPS translocon maturation chaperone LptM [Salinicola aestuarinus]|uniref:LPS translocon maturation chaperone LptM n=1 Tax=Salinicola aestuarinus TaxID=1949082 RepID=UPI000DA172A8
MAPNARRMLALLTLLALVALAGCGQTGPLYMPNDSDAAETYDPQGVHERDAPAPQATPLPDAPVTREEATPADPVDASPGMRTDAKGPSSEAAGSREGMRSREAPQ